MFNIILSNEVFMNGYVSVCDNVITYIGKEKPKADNYIEVDGYIAPGYADIHCHASPEISGNDDPYSVGDYHYKRGTTSSISLSVIFHALQTALIEETDYRNEQFALIHPGGAVGERLNK